MGVVGGVHVEQHEFSTLDLLADRAFPVPRQRGLLQTGEDVTASRNLLDVFVFRDHPVATVVESADPEGLLVPPDRCATSQLGEFFDG